MSIVGNVPRAPRFALRVGVRLRPVGTDPWEFGHTVDISRSGLLVVAAIAIGWDEPIEAIVQLSETTDTVADVWLRGRVTRLADAGGLRQLATTIDEYRFDSLVPFITHGSRTERR